MVNPIVFNSWQPVSPDDSADMGAFAGNRRLTDAIFVGTGGDVVAVTQGNTPITFKAVPSGTWLPLAVRRINATNTTAQNLVACYLV